MNILFVISSMDPLSGGPCQGIRNSIPALGKLGVHNEVVSLDSPAASFLNQDSFKVHAIGPTIGPWQYTESLIPWLIDHFERFDVVIANGLWLYQTHGIKVALEKYAKDNGHKKLPHFYIMPHGMLDPYFQSAKGRKLKAIRNWFYWQFFESKVINTADGLLFTCETELELARKSFRPYAPKKELNIGYGIPAPPAFMPNMYGAFESVCPQLKNRNYLLFLSRIDSKKGVDLLVNAYKKLINQHFFLPCLVIAGPGLETDYGKQLLRIVENDPQLRSCVFFVGMLTGDAKWGAFYGCDAFILPSHQENFGIAVVEALACAKSVLISNQVNIWHEIETNKAGIVADDTKAGTIELLEKWDRLDAEEKIKMALNAKQTYEKFFAIDPAALQMFKSLTANN